MPPRPTQLLRATLHSPLVRRGRCPAKRSPPAHCPLLPACQGVAAAPFLALVERGSQSPEQQHMETARGMVRATAQLCPLGCCVLCSLHNNAQRKEPHRHGGAQRPRVLARYNMPGLAPCTHGCTDGGQAASETQDTVSTSRRLTNFKGTPPRPRSQAAQAGWWTGVGSWGVGV